MGGDDRNLGDLGSQMTGWKSATQDELHVDEAKVKTFVGNVNLAQAQLAAQLHGADGLLGWLGNSAKVAEVQSAKMTRDHLCEDIKEFIKAAKDYSEYLSNVSDTTTRASINFTNQDASSR